ncbi:hypothetical protein P7K49_031120 [Saguinus oedipus]|uniref:Uncharacterized protein n=1 Tax=Saguinus oedipus TaxID=9490 RepID=A0ABQ9U4T8_SAGOE|nr:hypothetical protein P7K49_031120 [Saguinus oedipus]
MKAQAEYFRLALSKLQSCDLFDEFDKVLPEPPAHGFVSLVHASKEEGVAKGYLVLPHGSVGQRGGAELL